MSFSPRAFTSKEPDEPLAPPGPLQVRFGNERAGRVSKQTPNSRAGNSIAPLPIHFFTIVLNGQPFIQHHIQVLRQLPFQWHWHIVEGVAELNHDTAWSKATGGEIPAALHRHGWSIDGTCEYLDTLKREFPENISLYRLPAGKFWDGKRAMVNAPLGNINSECLLWQIDADELWTESQIIRTRALFLAHPEKTAAMFFCHYFVGQDLVIMNRDTYGNNPSYEWLRVWRHQAGDHWLSHEPPRLGRPGNGQPAVDVAALNPFTHAETEAMGLVFQHFAYTTEAQLEFKEKYYGYPGAVAQWRQLQAATTFPQQLADHFAWVKDDAMVNTTKAMGLQRIAPDTWFTPQRNKAPSRLRNAKKILFVRTDSIGDAVLASSLLEPIRQECPQAKLAVLCQQHVAEIFIASPLVDSIIGFDRKTIELEAERQQILAEIVDFNPDFILNSVRSRDHLSNVLSQLFRDAQHVAIEDDLNNILALDHAQSLTGYDLVAPSPGKNKTELEHHADFLRGLGIGFQNLQPIVWVGADAENFAETFFLHHGLDPQRTVALFPFTQHRIKNYPSFAAALVDFGDWNFLILGGPETQGDAAELARGLPGKVHNLSGQTHLQETAALIRRCRILVGSDSCGGHIACALGVPNVIILGGGHFGRFFPYNSLSSVVALPLDCYGCNWSCLHRRAHCITDISANVLRHAIHHTLAQASPRPRVFLQAACDWQDGANLPKWKHPDRWAAAMGVDIVEVDSQACAKFFIQQRRGEGHNLIELAQRIRGMMAEAKEDTALREIESVVKQTWANSLVIGRMFGDPLLDELCIDLGKSIFNRNIPPTTDPPKRYNEIFVATSIFLSGGHSAVIKDIACLSGRGNSAVLLTSQDKLNDKDWDSLVERFGSIDCELIQVPDLSFVGKVAWLQQVLQANRQARVWLVNHWWDSVAVAAFIPEIGGRHYFCHHADHHICLGVHVGHLRHVDLSPFSFHHCRHGLMVHDNLYLPLTLTSPSPPPPAERKFEALRTMTSGSWYKFSRPYAWDFSEVIAQMLGESGAQHFHVGLIPGKELEKIYESMRQQGVAVDRFVYVEQVESLSGFLTDQAISLYLQSFPYCGYKAGIEAMAAGIPIAVHVSYQSVQQSGIEMVYPEAFKWSEPGGLYELVRSVSLEELGAHAHFSRRWFESMHSPELVAAILKADFSTSATIMPKAPSTPSLNRLQSLRDKEAYHLQLMARFDERGKKISKMRVKIDQLHKERDDYKGRWRRLERKMGKYRLKWLFKLLKRC